MSKSGVRVNGDCRGRLADIAAAAGELNNVNNARDWLTPNPHQSSTVFDRLEIGLTRVKPGEKKNAQLFTQFVKKRLGTARFKPVTIKKRPPYP